MFALEHIGITIAIIVTIVIIFIIYSRGTEESFIGGWRVRRFATGPFINSFPINRYPPYVVYTW